MLSSCAMQDSNIVQNPLKSMLFQGCVHYLYYRLLSLQISQHSAAFWFDENDFAGRCEGFRYRLLSLLFGLALRFDENEFAGPFAGAPCLCPY
mmetsp:Transcript_98137/g.199276  ORF Transcript_98137/g.199276 Transcript_98137/m.199276 type:complete len:93 (-) Transcript_98137:1064-1342(-)